MRVVRRDGRVVVTDIWRPGRREPLYGLHPCSITRMAVAAFDHDLPWTVAWEHVMGEARPRSLPATQLQRAMVRGDWSGVPPCV